MICLVLNIMAEVKLIFGKWKLLVENLAEVKIQDPISSGKNDIEIEV